MPWTDDEEPEFLQPVKECHCGGPADFVIRGFYYCARHALDELRTPSDTVVAPRRYGPDRTWQR